MNRFLTLVLMAFAMAVPAAAQYDLSWFTIDSGGGACAGGIFELSGTIGHADASSFSTPMSGGVFELVGGFWTADAPPAGCPGQRGDTNCDGTVDFFDIDPFLTALFNNPQYLATYCGGSNCAVDVDESGTVDFFDIDPFLMCVFGDCP